MGRPSRWAFGVTSVLLLLWLVSDPGEETPTIRPSRLPAAPGRPSRGAIAETTRTAVATLPAAPRAIAPTPAKHAPAISAGPVASPQAAPSPGHPAAGGSTAGPVLGAELGHLLARMPVERWMERWPDLAAPRRDALGRWAFSAFVFSRDPAESKRQVEQLGGSASLFGGDLLIVEGPVEALEALASSPNSTRMTPARRAHLLNDAGRVAIRAAELNAGTGFNRRFLGAGALVGVIDSGIDFKHDDFRNADGSTRLLGIWDQTLTDGTPPAGFTGGVEYTRAQINAELGANPPGVVKQKATDNHGTHVAGSAAGNGRAGGGVLAGMAPQADLVVVKTNGSDTGIAEGMRWMIAVAKAAGKPIAVNASLGANGGPGDNTSPLEVALNRLAQPGAVLLVAAGNEGEDRIHAGGTATAQEQYFRVQRKADKAVPIEVYPDDGAQITVGIGAEDAQGVSTGETARVTSGIAAELPATTLNGVSVDIVSELATSRSTATRRRLSITIGKAAPDTGFFDLIVSGSGGFHAWISDEKSAGFVDAPGGGNGTRHGKPHLAGDNLLSINNFATATNVIAVASYVTKVQWTDIDGNARVQDATLNARSTFSSIGPSRVPAVTGQKPEIAAPGEKVASSLSADAAGAEARTDQLQGGKYTMSQGTSMATPHVAGVCALLLERAPRLTTALARDLLTASAVSDSFTTPTPLPNVFWGHGKVNAAAAMARLRVPTITPAIPAIAAVGGTATRNLATHESDPSDPPSALVWGFRDANRSQVSVSIATGTNDTLTVSPVGGFQATSSFTLVLSNSLGAIATQAVSVSFSTSTTPGSTTTSATLTIEKGLSLISLPLEPADSGAKPLDSGGLLTATGGSLLAYSEAAAGASKFRAFIPGFSTPIALKGGVGYAHISKQATHVTTLQGAPWPADTAVQQLTPPLALVGYPRGVTGADTSETLRTAAAATGVVRSAVSTAAGAHLMIYLPNESPLFPIRAGAGYLLPVTSAKTLRLPGAP